MMDMDDYPVFDYFKNIEPFSGKFYSIHDGLYYIDHHGKYFINKPYQLGFMSFNGGWVHKDKLQMLLRNRCITTDDVTYVLPASEVKSSSPLQKTCMELLRILGYDKCKFILNMITGIFGKKHKTKCRGIICEDENAMLCLWNAVEERNKCIVKSDQRYFFYVEDNIPLMQNHVPIYEYIIEAGHLELFNMYLIFSNPCTKVLCANTDTITFHEPNLSDEIKEKYMPYPCSDLD